MMSAAACFCLGCGISLPTGSYRRELSSTATRHVVPVWRQIISTVLDRQNLEVDEAEVLGDKKGFICRKCLRSYEAFEAAKEKLLQSANEAVKFMPSKPKATDRRRPLEEEDHSHDLMIPAKRARMVHNPKDSSSPTVQVRVQYKHRERNYILTPSRKHIGKAIARGSRVAVVSHCLEDAVVKKHVIGKIGKLLQTEIAALCSNRSNSILRRHSKDDLLSFKWDDVSQEMREHAPTLLSLMQAATHTRRLRPNQEAVIAMCTAMMCKLRRPEMSMAHKTLSLILYAGHASKQVFVRLHKLGLTMSYMSTIRLLEKLGENHDAQAYKWRKCILEHLESSERTESINCSIPEVSSCVLPEEIDSNGSAAPTSSCMDGATDDSASMLNSDVSQDGDIDISFASTCELDSPQASRQDVHFTVDNSPARSLLQSSVSQHHEVPCSSLDFASIGPPPVGPHHAPSVGPDRAPPVDLHHSPPIGPPPVGPHHAPPVGPHHAPPVGPHHTPPVGPHHTPPVGPHHAPPVGPHHAPPVGLHHAPPVGPHHAPDGAHHSFPVTPQHSPPIGPQHPPCVHSIAGPHESPSTSDNSPVGPQFSPLSSPIGPQNLACDQQQLMPLGDPNQVQSLLESTKDTSTPQPLHGMKLCGDNIDWTVHPRYIRSDQQTQSIHYFHSYAIKDRVDISSLSDAHPNNQPSTSEVLTKVIPSAHEDSIIHNNFVVLLARMLCSNVKFFKETFADVVDWHITHKYSAEMSTKSEVIPLGLLMKNENKYSEMIDIMSHFHQYVPVLQGGATTDPAVNNSNLPNRETLHPLLFGGDQLTAARARGCQELRINSDTAIGRLRGLVPTAEDWHTLVTLLVVIWKRLYSTQSSTDFGTLHQLRNLINRRNVITHPEKDVNATEDFLTLVVTSHFIAACMKQLGMESLDAIPNTGEFNANTWMMSDVNRKTALYSFCQQVITDHVNVTMCGDISCSKDGVLNYANEVMSLGIFYLNYKDAIHEGDGGRVLLCWKYLLPIFKVSDRRNYSLEVLRMLYSYYFTLSPRQKCQLLWSRFVNVHGLPGCNIPGDLHMEHLNHVCKQAIQGIGSRKRKEAITRIGKAVGPLAAVTSNFDENVLKPTNKHLAGHHKRASDSRDQEMIISELLNHACVFSEKVRSHRQFKSFNNKSSIFMKVNNKTFEKWIKDNIPDFD